MNMARKIAASLFVFGMLISAGIVSASVRLGESNANSLSNGLVGYWPLDGNTTSWITNTTQDVSGNGNTGTLVNMSTTTSPVAGKIGGALYVNGQLRYGGDSITEQRIENSTVVLATSSAVTISFWLNIGTQPSNYRRVLSSQANGGSSIDIYFTGNGSGGLYGNIGNAFSPYGWICQAPDLRGGWKHVVITASAADGKVRCYFNGDYIVSGQASSFTQVQIKNLFFGVDPSYNYPLKGTLDDVR